MRKRVRLEAIAVRDLNRNPGEILARVRRGERFIVCWHRQPVATLQPLDGFAVDPFAGGEYDVYGSPPGDVHAEAAKLSDVQRDLLTEAYAAAASQWQGSLIGGPGRRQREPLTNCTSSGWRRRRRRDGRLPGADGCSTKLWRDPSPTTTIELAFDEGIVTRLR